jgi:hypothetical protein
MLFNKTLLIIIVSTAKMLIYQPQNGDSWSAQVVDDHNAVGGPIASMVNNGDEVFVFYGAKSYNIIDANKSSNWGSSWDW